MSFIESNYYACVLLYLKENNISVNFTELDTDKNFMLLDASDGNGIQIDRWEYDIPKPTREQLSTYTEDDYKAAVIEQTKASFATVSENLRKIEPKFALVYKVIEKICIDKLRMSSEEYGEMCQTVWDKWADETPT